MGGGDNFAKAVHHRVADLVGPTAEVRQKYARVGVHGAGQNLHQLAQEIGDVHHGSRDGGILAASGVQGAVDRARRAKGRRGVTKSLKRCETAIIF